MGLRLPRGGRRIDRSRTFRFTFDGRAMTGHPGDSLASALMAQDRMLVGRSFKYHRPRGTVAFGGEEPNALVNLGTGNRMEPNAKAPTVPLTDGLVAASQNRWPTLDHDVGAVNARLARFLPAGFYYKTFMWPRSFWKHVYEPVIRQSAGLGRAPEGPDPDHYEHMHVFADVLIAGGGIAGLTAALAAARAGASVILAEQTAHWGGRAVADGAVIDGRPAADWVEAAVAELRAMERVRLLTRTMVAGIYDHGASLMSERLEGQGDLRERLWKVRSDQVVVAAGAIERPIAFAGNDLPGVMLAGAVRDYLDAQAVVPGRRTVVVTANDDAYRTALALHAAGLEVPAVIDARPAPSGPLVRDAEAAGIRVLAGRAILAAKGRGRVEKVEIGPQAGAGGAVEEVISCDSVAMSGGWSPAVHLWSHAGGKLHWDEAQAMFRPDDGRGPIGHDGTPSALVCGTANGVLDTAGVLADAHAAGEAAARRTGAGGTAGEAPGAQDEAAGPPMAVWSMPARAGTELQSKSFLDFQNDVKVSDVRLAAREGFESVEHAKRYTTLGMATDQGKLSNVNGLAILSDQLGQPIPQTGTTTFRPPYSPITFGAIAGPARGASFQPVRRTPMYDWHDANGAHWEPVGQWRRPYCYPRGDESVEDAVAREVTNARTALGLLDASTLGKIVVKGPDAGRFLDMLYTNMMSTLKPGRCRYGLMCSENGFLIDDGVVARISEDEWLCHTTTGGADHIHQHMEEWLQTEWWDWKVWTANVTEQWAQVAVVGPNARRALEALGGMDVSKEAMAFMTWSEGTLAGIPARVFRISFSGELSYEVAVPADRGLELWEKLHEVGADLGAMPYGTECLHVLRAEKGFIMIGDETDGTVIPQDLGLSWAISKKKDDYLGKRAQERTHMADPERWQLVGLETEDGDVLPDGAYAALPDVNANGQRGTEGRVTSTYYSPTLGRGIAMGLVHRGTERMGEVISFPRIGGGEVRARIVSPVFYDAEGEKQDA